MNLRRAQEIAIKAHKGQVDKGGHDYIGHPLRVMDCVKGDNHEDIENTRIVAVLHDVIEDTDITIRELQREGFNDKVIAGIRCMTRRDGQTWNSYIEGVKDSKIAVRVKICDLRDNLDLTRLRNLKDLNIISLNMYIIAYHKLIKYERENR